MALIGSMAHDLRSVATRLCQHVDHLPDANVRKRTVADMTDVDHHRTTSAQIDLHIAATVKTTMLLGDRLALHRMVADLIDNRLAYGQAVHVRR